MNKNKNLITIPLINIWYVIVTLIFILMRILNIIDWSPLWILSPLWIPWVIALCLMILPYLLIAICWILFKIYNFTDILYRKYYKKYILPIIMCNYKSIKKYVIKFCK